MNLDKLMDIMRDRQYTLQMRYDGEHWIMSVYDPELEEVTGRVVKDSVMVKPKIAAAALSIVKELS